MILLWIAIAIVVFLLIKYGNKIKIPGRSINNTIVSVPTSSPKKTSWLRIVSGVIGIIIGICILVFTVSYAWSFASSFFEKKETQKKHVHIEVFEVPATAKGIPKYLHPGWQAYPTKAITVITPTGKRIENTPGTPTYPGYQPQGWYYFLTKERDCQVKIEDVY